MIYHFGIITFSLGYFVLTMIIIYSKLLLILKDMVDNFSIFLSHTTLYIMFFMTIYSSLSFFINAKILHNLRVELDFQNLIIA